MFEYGDGDLLCLSFMMGADSINRASWRSVVAGTLAGTIETTITYPFEFIKTQLQLSQDSTASLKSSGISRSLSIKKKKSRDRGDQALFEGKRRNGRRDPSSSFPFRRSSSSSSPRSLFSSPLQHQRRRFFLLATSPLAPLGRERRGCCCCERTFLRPSLFSASACRFLLPRSWSALVNAPPPPPPHSSNTSSLSVIRTTLGKNGLLGFYRGFRPWLMFGPYRTSVRFYTYEKTLSFFCDIEHPSSSRSAAATTPIWASAAAGCVSGAIEYFFCVTPMLNIAIKAAQDSLRGDTLPRSVYAASKELIHRFGVGFLFKGADVTVVKGICNHMIRFASFHFLTEEWKERIRMVPQGVREERGPRERKEKKERRDPWSYRDDQRGREREAEDERERNVEEEGVGRLNPFANLTCGAFAGLLSVIVTHPIDTIKSNVQSLEGNR